MSEAEQARGPQRDEDRPEAEVGDESADAVDAARSAGGRAEAERPADEGPEAGAAGGTGAGAADGSEAQAGPEDGAEAEAGTETGVKAAAPGGSSTADRDAAGGDRPSDRVEDRAREKGRPEGEDVNPGGSSAEGRAGDRPGDRDAKGPAAADRHVDAPGNGRSVSPGKNRDAVVAGRAEKGGRLLAGRYRLGAVLGKGGMGTVWRAVDETLGRTVAVKELRFPTNIDEDEKRRLITRTMREAKAIARIRNNGAVTVFDVVDEDDRPWIVMELIEGASLAEVIREKGTLSPRRAAEVGLAILDVLRSAHREGILHRDVKPSNVLISEDGRVVLTDFGIAQVEGDPSVTSTGMLVGAPSYISPERARGHKPGPPADLWSLGGLLYASVEGIPPYDKGSAIATLTAVMTEPLDPPKGAGELEEVIYGLLAKDPKQRLDDAGARALLNAVVHAPEPVAEPEPEPAGDATRVVALPPVPAEERTTQPKAAAAAERMRGALQSVRNAAAAAEPGPAPATRATLTDVVPRRTLAIVAVVAVLAILGTILAVALGGDSDQNGQDSKSKDDKAASSGATAGGEGSDKGKEKDPGTDTGKGADKGSGDATGTGKDKGQGAGTGEAADSGKTGGSSGDDALPAGYKTVTDSRFHFTMAMPAGFKRHRIAGQNSGGIYSASPGGFPRVQVDFNDSPSDDAALAWAQLAPAVAGSSSGYKLLGLGKVEYNGYPTVADWQFERSQGGERVRILNRGFKVDAKHGYSIMVTCKQSEWDGAECRTLRKTAFDTFRPKD